jgi:chromate transporter
MIPIMQVEFVEKLRWLEEEGFVDIITLAQAAPGAMVINLSVYLGHMLFGFPGAAVALLGAALPSFVIMGVIALFFAQLKERFALVERALEGVKPVVAGVIFAAAVRMMDGVGATWLNCLMALGAVTAVAALGVSPILCIAAGGALGMLLMRERGKGDA